MSSGRRSVTQSKTAEQHQKEAEIAAGLCNAEREAVVQIFSQARTPAGLLHVLNNPTGFAETMAESLRHPRTPKVDCKGGCHWCCYQRSLRQHQRLSRLRHSSDRQNFSWMPKPC